MGNEPPTLGLDDGTMDVDCLLVEPQDGNVSMDSVMCFNEKITDNALDSEVPKIYGHSGAADARDKKDIHNEQVLDAIPNGDGFQIHDHFCSMGDDYLLGVEFGESITNVDFGSGEGLKVSVSNSQTQVPSSPCFLPWKSEIIETPECSKLENVPNICGCGVLAEDHSKNAPESCTSQDINCRSIRRFNASVSDSGTQGLDAVFINPWKLETNKVPTRMNGQSNTGSSGSNDDSALRGCKFLYKKKALASCDLSHLKSKAKEVPNCENGEEIPGNVEQEKRLRRQRSSKASAQGSCNVHPVEKRLRKPTQRYIDELSYPITSKKRRELSSSKDEPTGTKVRRKCDAGFKAIKSDEEFSVKAIQVPFGAIVNQECPVSPVHVALHDSDRRTWTNRSRGELHAPENNQKRKNGNGESSHLKKNDDRATGLFLKEAEDVATESSVKKRSTRRTTANEQKKYDWVMSVSPKKKDTHLAAANKEKKTDRVTALGRKSKDNSLTPKKAVVNRSNKLDIVISSSTDIRDDNSVSKAHQKEREEDDDVASESPEQGSGRRKNHRLWTISEVGKLLDGVSQYGVGRWSRIKKLLFASSPHRTSVDLKDKWRNLLKASGLHDDQSKNGGKKRNVPWRPLPKSVLRHVRELASMHPYPKAEGRRFKNARKNNKNNNNDSDDDDDDGTTDITLSDYRRILQSTNGDEL